MNSKIFTLFAFALIATFVSLTMVSAATFSTWDLTTDAVATGVSDDVTVTDFALNTVTFDTTPFDTDDGAQVEGWPTGGSSTADTTKYFEVTITPASGKDLTITNINFDYTGSAGGPASFDLEYSKAASFASPTNIITETDLGSASTESSTNTVDIAVDEGETLTLRWFGYVFTDDTNEFNIKNLVIEGTSTSSTDEELLLCTEDNVFTDEGNLRIKIDEIRVEQGFGDDDDFWYMFDEIEIDFEIENNNDDEKIKDIEVEWGIWSNELNDWVLELDDEKDFDLKKDDEKIITVSFTIDNKLDIDLDDLEAEDLVLIVSAKGEEQADDGNDFEVCSLASEEIDFMIDTDFIIVRNIEFPEIVTPGQTFEITADVWNVGSDEQEDIEITVKIDSLNFAEIFTMDIDEFEDESLKFQVTVPNDATSGSHIIRFTVRDDDGDIFETDEDEDESVYITSIKVEGENMATPTVTIVAELTSEAIAGKELIVKTTITNTGDSTVAYQILATDLDDWATLGSIEPRSFTLPAGQSTEVTITLLPNADAEGSHEFTIQTVYEGISTEQTFEAEIKSSSAAGFTGSAIGSNIKDNWFIWVIALINIVLVILIVVVAVRMASR